MSENAKASSVNRAKLYQLVLFPLNNGATNVYYVLVLSYIATFGSNVLALGTLFASVMVTAMRLCDAITDPIIGALMDRTNGKFGKFRPFMAIGNLIMAASILVLYGITPMIPDTMMWARYAAFVGLYFVWVIGYPFQTSCTRSGQTVLTNDPKQRPLFASFDGVYNTVLFAGLAVITANIANSYKDVGGYASTQFFHTFWLLTAIVSGIFTLLAVIAIAPKDRPEFFGTGKPVKVGLKDYWDTLKNNRAIQMLVLSASTDKLGNTAKTSAVQVALFACIAGSTLLQGNVTALTTVPVCILTFLCISTLATKFGQRKGMIIGSVGALIGNGALIALWLLGDPTTMTSNPETGALNWGYFLILYIVLTVLTGGFQNLAGNIVIPMTADCADYEVYRSGKYVPGLMGTLFSFVDKLVSSFAPMIAGAMFTACGFVDHNPVMGDPVTMKLRIGTALCAYGVIMIGLVCNLIAMHFYPLTKEKMAEIQDEVVKIKMAAAQNA